MVKLCEGFRNLTDCFDGLGHRLVEYYAFLDNGITLVSELHREDLYFDRPSRQWYIAAAVPSTAEFIGNYPVPRQVLFFACD